VRFCQVRVKSNFLLQFGVYNADIPGDPLREAAGTTPRRVSVLGYLNVTAGKVLTAVAFVAALGAPRKWA
jgi:hypothetical protein